MDGAAFGDFFCARRFSVPSHNSLRSDRCSGTEAAQKKSPKPRKVRRPIPPSSRLAIQDGKGGTLSGRGWRCHEIAGRNTCVSAPFHSHLEQLGEGSCPRGYGAAAKPASQYTSGLTSFIIRLELSARMWDAAPIPAPTSHILACLKPHTHHTTTSHFQNHPRKVPPLLM